MKKILLFLSVLVFSTTVFAQLQKEQVIGKWNYTVLTDQGEMTGTLNFVEKEEILTGEVWADDGSIIPLTKVELKKDNILYFELEPNYDVYKVTVKVEGEEFSGSGTTSQGDFNLTGKKRE